jgi:hypothetical protein
MLLVATATGCASTMPRFRDQPIVWYVRDDRNMAQPEENEFFSYSYMPSVLAFRPLTRALELPDHEPAHNTNALDEVPNSTWFTNRIGARTVSPEEAARGPMEGAPPQAPFTIVKGKSGGGNPGFIVEDGQGRRYVLKFDTKDNPEMQTATGVIVNRAFWTLGYNVPSDSITYFRREELRIAPDAHRSDDFDNDVPVTQGWVEDVLAQSPRLADGSYRVFVSLFLEGIPVGGWSPEGTRSDDPNDQVPHEHRREVRALRVFSAWLGHTDMKQDNTLDMYVEEDGRHFLRHYLVDFGEALGAHQAEKGRLEDGWEHVWDFELNGAALLTLGLWSRPWEDQEQTLWPSIGAFGAEHFDPQLWREAYPYVPFREADAADLYWGAKLVMRFSRAHVEAIIAEGQLSSPDAATYLADALMERRRRIGQAWLEAVTPLDYFTMRDGQLCAVDLGVRFGLAADGIVELLPADYRPDFDDDRDEADRHARGVREFRVAADGTVCLPIPEDEAYTIARLRIRRGPNRHPIMQVHHKAGANPRVLGIIRVE